MDLTIGKNCDKQHILQDDIDNCKLDFLIIICQRQSEYYLITFTNPKVNNCFSIIIQVII